MRSKVNTPIPDFTLPSSNRDLPDRVGIRWQKPAPEHRRQAARKSSRPHRFFNQLQHRRRQRRLSSPRRRRRDCLPLLRQVWPVLRERILFSPVIGAQTCDDGYAQHCWQIDRSQLHCVFLRNLTSSGRGTVELLRRSFSVQHSGIRCAFDWALYQLQRYIILHWWQHGLAKRQRSRNHFLLTQQKTELKQTDQSFAAAVSVQANIWFFFARRLPRHIPMQSRQRYPPKRTMPLERTFFPSQQSRAPYRHSTISYSMFLPFVQAFLRPAECLKSLHAQEM